MVVDGETSDKVPVISGAARGTVYGPLLFLLFINDLPADVETMPILLDSIVQKC